MLAIDMLLINATLYLLTYLLTYLVYCTVNILYCIGLNGNSTKMKDILDLNTAPSWIIEISNF